HSTHLPPTHTPTPTRRSSDLQYGEHRQVHPLARHHHEIQTDQDSQRQKQPVETIRIVTSFQLCAFRQVLLCQRIVVRRHRLKSSDRKSTRLNSSHVKISYAVF